MLTLIGKLTVKSSSARMARTMSTLLGAGIPMIEAVERTDKTFAVGLQFHPEAAIVKHLNSAGNRDDFMDYDTALSIFQWIVQEQYLAQEDAA